MFLAVAAILTLVSGLGLAGPLPFAAPLLRVGGLLQPAPGHRLFVVALESGRTGRSRCSTTCRWPRPCARCGCRTAAS